MCFFTLTEGFRSTNCENVGPVVGLTMEIILTGFLLSYINILGSFFFFLLNSFLFCSVFLRYPARNFDI